LKEAAGRGLATGTNCSMSTMMHEGILAIIAHVGFNAVQKKKNIV
jgi:hypothetical protein